MIAEVIKKTSAFKLQNKPCPDCGEEMTDDVCPTCNPEEIPGDETEEKASPDDEELI
ncbi:MAG: hypothetical protein Q8N28_03290 [bacterium]|nr:hypothetical protein [bacterium]